MNTFVEMLHSFDKTIEAEKAWKRAILATEQQRLKAFLDERDEQYLREHSLLTASTIGNPLLRMNE